MSHKLFESKLPNFYQPQHSQRLESTPDIYSGQPFSKEEPNEAEYLNCPVYRYLGAWTLKMRYGLRFADGFPLPRE